MDEQELAKIEQTNAQWRARVSKVPQRDAHFITVSGEAVKLLATPEDLQNFDYVRDLNNPGDYPYTRGVYDNMYRGKLWTMRQFAGFGTAADSNRRYKYLLEQGQTGLSVAFDLPTLMGYDSDDPWSEGEVGRCGVAISSLEDMQTLFDGIPLDRISTSMTINSPAAILLAMYIAVAEQRGIDSRQLTGTLQNDILKEYIAQNEYIFPPQPSMRLITDTMAFCSEHVPKWNTISISGYHIREAGATAVQELAFTLADGFAYVEAGIAAGMPVDSFAPRLSFFFNAHLDFFEEIAKYRAARRIWARKMKEKYQARDPRSWRLRFHTQTAGCSLTAQQPTNNIIRTAFEALAAVLGGTQSLHTNSMDETWALPTEEAVTIALRTQQLIAYESGVPNTIDPLAGSYFVEDLTNKMEAQAEEYFRKIDEIGGVLVALEKGFFQKEIADAAYRYQKQIEAKQRIVVGVNEFVEQGETLKIDILKIDPRIEREQSQRLADLRARRDNLQVQKMLEQIRQCAQGRDNLMPVFIQAVRANVTLGEIVNALKDVFGVYRESVVQFGSCSTRTLSTASSS